MKRGQKIGPYVVQERLGKGAMGEVWLAQHVELGHRYALKVLGRHLLEDRTALKRFEVEMEGLARVDGHPGIVRVHSAGRTREGLPWIAMEYVKGRQLTAELKDGLPLAQALRMLVQVARALGHAHARGLVHRDVKPDNVLVGKDGAARLTDFGLAKLLDREQRLTRSQDLVGTPFYLAPEQANQSMGEVGPWSDVYSLGALLYEVLVGEPPHMGTTTVEVCNKVVHDPVVPPSLRKDGIPPGVEAVCMRALSRDPRARQRDGNELADELERALTAGGIPSGTGKVEEPDPAQPAPPLLTEKERLQRRRLHVKLAAAVAALTVLMAGGALVAKRAREASRVAEVEAKARETAAAAAALERRLRGAKGEAAAALVELTRLEAELPGESLPEVQSAREALHRALDVARIEAAREAWERGDTATARSALGPNPTSGPTEACRPWILLLSGEPAAVLSLTPALPPEAQARAAAWAGQLDAARAALAALPAEQASALGAELASLLPALRAPPPAPGASRAAEWSGLAASCAALADGLPGLATTLLDPTPPAGASAELVAAHALQLARTALARGDLAGARAGAQAAVHAAETAAPPLLLTRARALLQELELADEAQAEAPRAVLATLAPGLPGLPQALGRARLLQAWTAGERPDLAALLGAPLGPVDRARAAARAGDRAAARAELSGLLALAPDAPERGSFLQLEQRACASGKDGAAGLLLARSAALAELSLRGDAWEEAEEALRFSTPLLRLRPESPTLWVARSRAARVLHRPGEALQAAERALLLSPGDPAASLELARARLAREIHGLPGGGEPDAARLRAELARARGEPDSSSELAAGEALGPALEAFRAAREQAHQPDAPAPALERAARLGAAEVLLERARRRVLGGGTRLESTPVELSELESELAPLLATVRVVELARARTRLATALLHGDAAEVRAAEDALCEERPRCSSDELQAALQALRLRALSGQAGAEKHVDAFLALAVDLPARALWHLEASAGGSGEADDVERALRLAPELPAGLLADDYLAATTGQDEAQRCLRLARLVLEAPTAAGLVPLLAGLGVVEPDVPLPPALAQGDDALHCLARALAASARHAAAMWRRLGARGNDTLVLGTRVVQELERSLQQEPIRPGIYQLLALALTDLARLDPGSARERELEPRLQAEGRLATLMARAGAPWTLGPRLAEVSLVPSDALRTAALAVFLRGGGEVLRDQETRLLAVRSTQRRRDVMECLGKTLSADPPSSSDAAGLLERARRLADSRREAGDMALVLQVRAAALRRRAELALPPFPEPLSPHLRERLLGPQPLNAAGVEAVGAAFSPGQQATLRALLPAEPGPAPAESALRALWLSAPAGELAAPLDLELMTRPLRLPAAAPDMHRSLLLRVQGDLALRECGDALRSPGVALRRLRAVAPPRAIPTPREGQAASFLPWSAREALLRDPLSADAWVEALATQPLPGPEELRLLLERASLLERGEPLAPASARVAALARGLALRPDQGRERTRLQSAALSLVRAVRTITPAPPGPLLLVTVDLALDLAALQEGTGEARATLASACQDAETGAGDAKGLPDGTPARAALLRWSLARARALAGDDARAAEALAEAGKLLDEDPVQLVPFRAWVACDPWLARLRGHPPLARFLSTWVPE